jgi:pimeloyl-ACP methyl ester carboxylesterase
MQGVHRDGDALILTGFSHTPNFVGVGIFEVSALYPAAREPRFRDRPAGYLTTAPGVRETVFYAPGTAEPEAITMDERTKETTVDVIEAGGQDVATAMAGTATFDVPVLVAAGEFDTIVCGLPACMAEERRFYGRPDRVSTLSVAGSGHDLNTSKPAPQFFRDVVQWANSTVGPGPARPSQQ